MSVGRRGIHRPMPAVVIDDATVDLGVRRRYPGADTISAMVMHHQVYQLHSASIHVDPRPVEGRIGRRVRHFKAPVPRVLPQNRECIDGGSSIATDNRPLTGILTHDDRSARRTCQTAGKNARVDPAPEPDGVTWYDGGRLGQGCGQIPWFRGATIAASRS